MCFDLNLQPDYYRNMNLTRRFWSLAIFAVLSPTMVRAETFRIAEYNIENYLDQPTETRHSVKSDEAKAKIRESIHALKPDVLKSQYGLDVTNRADTTLLNTPINSPTVLGRKLIVHSDQVTVSCAVNKIDHGTRLTSNGQIDWPAANAAIFDQRLFRLRGVDLQRKNFAAMRTGDFSFDD